MHQYTLNEKELLLLVQVSLESQRGNNIHFQSDNQASNKVGAKLHLVPAYSLKGLPK